MIIFNRKPFPELIFNKLDPHFVNFTYTDRVKFEDHIMAPRVPFDRRACWARFEGLYALIMSMSGLGSGMLLAAKALGREFRALIKVAEVEHRYKLKLNMLRHPEWRHRVMQDLGGIDALWHWWCRRSRLNVQPPHHRPRAKLSLTEQRRRAHIRLCAKASANPNIYRDPFKVDLEGQFRLPPLPQLPLGEGVRANKPPKPYHYDARPVTKFSGFKTPISVWPEEFLVFAEMDIASEAIRRSTHVFMAPYRTLGLAERMEADPVYHITPNIRDPVCAGTCHKQSSVSLG